ncbi:G2/mitotic-specific cyclin-B [Capronia epimyces CBS 606.96]|uniref:G2/mitotic-specific cyclin-B n=1 Tax=Capronia epimyces CBS 606.96 TaxID=1182542 RepID=W9YRY7_9EURO|nr:G2/mitotic-specific cyclin-B [Capronia epimyces CBS 606.96]EXJ85044.1 G2/mitotic-specific cyclin-B [Capronia epimyces CBS 606.96]
MPVSRTRQRVVNNENDENNAIQSTRLTRAKAAVLSNAQDASLAKKPLQTKKSTAGTLNGTQRRRALGDVTNAAKGVEVVPEGKKAVGGRVGLQSKVAQPTAGGVQKLSRTNSSRAALGVKDNNTKPKVGSDVKKPGSGSGVLGNAQKRRTQISTSTVSSSKDATPDIDEPPRKKPCSEEAVEEAQTEESYDIVADLDAEDIDDPSMCAEYVREIFEYYFALEEVTQPNPQYMDHQDDLEWKMRGILVDWLIEVHTRFRLLPETLFLAVNIVDRFLSQKVVPLDKLQLVGITAMFIASKYEEVLSPHVGNFVHVADDGFTVEEVLSAERYTLSTLKYDLSYPNPMNFLRRISKADSYDIQTRTLGKYLMEISLVDHRFLEYKQSHIAAAAMYLARMILERGGWDATLTKFAGYTEEEILPVFDLMVNYLEAPVAHEALFKKYASKKFLKASIMSRKWAKDYGASRRNGGASLSDLKVVQ